MEQMLFVLSACLWYDMISILLTKCHFYIEEIFKDLPVGNFRDTFYYFQGYGDKCFLNFGDICHIYFMDMGYFSRYLKGICDTDTTLPGTNHSTNQIHARIQKILLVGGGPDNVCHQCISQRVVWTALKKQLER